jgi:hypothetical protein
MAAGSRDRAAFFYLLGESDEIRWMPILELRQRDTLMKNESCAI